MHCLHVVQSRGLATTAFPFFNSYTLTGQQFTNAYAFF